VKAQFVSNTAGEPRLLLEPETVEERRFLTERGPAGDWQALDLGALVITTDADDLVLSVSYELDDDRLTEEPVDEGRVIPDTATALIIEDSGDEDAADLQLIFPVGISGAQVAKALKGDLSELPSSVVLGFTACEALVTKAESAGSD